MPYTIAHLAQILAAEWISTSSSSPVVAHLLFDSRQLQSPEETLFFAIRGQRHDGHTYIQSLYDRGVRAFVVEDKASIIEGDAHFLVVENTVTALQQLAIFHRRQFDLDVIGITGSNGKTIVKEWLFQLLHHDQSIVRSPKSYNSQIGVPLSVWQIQAQHQLGLFEAGISKVGEMEKLAPIIDCHIGIFTTIGSAHNAGFPSTEIKIQEKLKLFEKAQTLIYHKDYPLLHQAIQNADFQQVLDWSFQDKHAAFYIQDKQITDQNCRLTGFFNKKKQEIQIPFTDDASIENAIHCWTYLLYQQYPTEIIQQRMAQLEPVAMRLELKAGVHQSVLINDSYNSDLESLRIALHFMQQQANRNDQVLILSDMLQTGLQPQILAQRIADLLNKSAVEKLIGIGHQTPLILPFLEQRIHATFYPSTTDFLQHLQLKDFANKAILIKGARQFNFEQISNRLAQKVHQTVLEVNLSALLHNLQQYSQQLAPDTNIMAMVKASGYGSGSFEVAQALQHRVDYFGVAYADEGVELRQAGIQKPILVLNAEKAVFETLMMHQLEPEIYSVRQLEDFLAFLPYGQRYPIHLNLDTGMKRLGFEGTDIDKICQILKQYASKVLVKSIFSHLAASEAQQHDAFTLQQVTLFEQYYKKISQAIGYQPWRHILNSSGILRFPQYQMDMVRLGIGLYGIDSSELLQPQLQVVNTLKASISQIKSLLVSETVGYGRIGQLPTGGRIATISIGYADGLLRQAGQGRYQVYVHGQLAPIVGNVCMDMCMIDISEIPQAQEGDVVEVFGTHQPVQVLADCLGTIPYEVFTNISERVKRIYYQE